MFGVLLATILLVLMCGGYLFVWIAWHCFSPSRSNKVTSYILLVLGFTTILLLHICVTYGINITSTGDDVPYEEYRGVGPPLPPEAAHITYSSSSSGCDAIFAISENGFRQWADETNLSIKTITTPVTIRLSRIRRGLIVKRGLFATALVDDSSNSGSDIVYDSDTGTCVVQYSAY